MRCAKKLLVAAGTFALVAQPVAQAADYPPVPPPPYYQPPQPVYQPPPQPIYQTAPQPIYQPPPQVYVPPPPPPPPPPVVTAPPPILQQAVASDFGGWYLRGDIGVSAQKFVDFKHTQTNSTFHWPDDWKIEHTDLKDSVYFSLGVGYSFTSFFRMDVTGEYRQSTKGKVTGSYGENCDGGGICYDVYDFDHQASVLLINAYLDMGTWWCFTPFVGFGIGGAYHTFHAMTDYGFNSSGTTGFGLMSDKSHDWTFAWAIHAGVAYEVTKSLKIELAYRYLDLGSPETGVINCGAFGCAGTGPRAFYTLNELTANELRLGVRWMFDCCEAPLPPPPVYQPPPLMRRG